MFLIAVQINKTGIVTAFGQDISAEENITATTEIEPYLDDCGFYESSEVAKIYPDAVAVMEIIEI